jgi:hypothetical protein
MPRQNKQKRSKKGKVVERAKSGSRAKRKLQKEEKINNYIFEISRIFRRVLKTFIEGNLEADKVMPLFEKNLAMYHRTIKQQETNLFSMALRKYCDTSLKDMLRKYPEVLPK